MARASSAANRAEATTYNTLDGAMPFPPNAAACLMLRTVLLGASCDLLFPRKTILEKTAGYNASNRVVAVIAEKHGGDGLKTPPHLNRNTCEKTKSCGLNLLILGAFCKNVRTGSITKRPGESNSFFAPSSAAG
jgi:hypothetical protein